MARTSLLKLAVVLAVPLLLAGPALAGVKADIGYTDLQARLGGSTPTGAGIDATQVEALYNSGDPGSYFPDASVSPSQLGSKTINDVTGSGTDSPHARSVAYRFYGDVSSMATGISVIDVYEVNDWLGSGFLRTNGVLAPKTEARRIQNHSWVGNFTLDSDAINALRRMDKVVVRDDVLATAAVANGSASAFPDVLGNAYNVVTVGRTDGNHSDGPTTLDTAGRAKVDIVVPETATSYATAWVSAAGALLMETADNNGAMINARHALTVKALLLGGATKDEFDLDGNTGTRFDDWSRTSTRPLDYRYGAGELNIDNSHRILEAGEQEASNSSDVALTGWDYDQASSSSSQLYFFEAGNGIEELSILLTWFREIGNDANLTPSLANLDLALYEANGYTLGSLVDQSISTVDNVEHIFGRNLAAGRYAIAVTGDQTWTYALTWDVAPAPEPLTLILLLGGVAPALLAIRRRRAA